MKKIIAKNFLYTSLIFLLIEFAMLVYSFFVSNPMASYISMGVLLLLLCLTGNKIRATYMVVFYTKDSVYLRSFLWFFFPVKEKIYLKNLKIKYNINDAVPRLFLFYEEKIIDISRLFQKEELDEIVVEFKKLNLAPISFDTTY